jgi:anthranilate phosphoribosyltransferase
VIASPPVNATAGPTAGAVASGPHDDSALRSALRTIADGETLAESAASDAFDVVMAGGATPAQMGALLMGMRARGETPPELTGAVRALRRVMVHLPAERPDELVDTCGTGGGVVTTFNISTVAAFVAAGTGVRVAKHGNRSYTSLCGSADLLEALGVLLDAPVPVLGRVLADAGIVFMFAPAMHPAMRHVAPVRRELGVATVMNLVGPLANPAGVGRQVIGVSDPERLALVAAALRTLDVAHALVVHGTPGLDEISPLGPTRVVEVRPDGERYWTIDPRDFDLDGGAPSHLQCGDPATNARIATTLLSGHGPAGARSAIALNAAAAIYVSGRVASFPAAVTIALDALDRGLGLEALERMRAAYAAASAHTP